MVEVSQDRDQWCTSALILGVFNGRIHYISSNGKICYEWCIGKLMEKCGRDLCYDVITKFACHPVRGPTRELLGSKQRC